MDIFDWIAKTRLKLDPSQSQHSKKYKCEKVVIGIGSLVARYHSTI